MNDLPHIALFERQRPFLLGLAYRILGSRSDAEDAVQDTFLKWHGADRAVLENPAAWLTTACTRRCLNILASAQRARTHYVGSWLPEPIQMATGSTPEQAAELTSTLSTAFLLLLERLSPKERAAYLLHDIFDLSYTDCAQAIDTSEAACRKLVSRARGNIGKPAARRPAPQTQQIRLLDAFHHAVATGETDRLALLLTEDVALVADGGGKVSAFPEPVSGRTNVLNVIGSKLSAWWRSYTWEAATINGGPGVLLFAQHALAAAVSIACDDLGRASGIYIMRNPDKLALLLERKVRLS